MSYNLFVEGDLDLFALSNSTQYLQSIEIFPIDSNALGIALPSSRADDNARTELTQLVQQMLAIEATVYDLVTGEKIQTSADLDALFDRIFG
jgi:hypothetical protein